MLPAHAPECCVERVRHAGKDTKVLARKERATTRVTAQSLSLPNNVTEERFALTVLGASPAWQNPGGACSGYIVWHGQRAVVLDCGSGVVGHLREHVPLEAIEAVVISHLHADHYFDLVPLFYGRRYGGDWSPDAPRLPVYLPPRGHQHMRRLGEVVSGDGEMFEPVYDLREHAGKESLSIAGLEFEFHRVQHYVPSYAMRIRCGERVLVFSSDVAPCAALPQVASQADLFLCESALVDLSQDESDPARRGHLLPSEAGAAAREAQANRLLITHFAHSARDLVADEAAEAYGSAVELVEEGATFTI